MTGPPANPPAPEEPPLAGTLVVDVSRMLPGAALARVLLDLGARLVKVEQPGSGDPMRHVEPRAGGAATGFATFFRGAESLCLDLSVRAGAERLLPLARRADVFVESFRPGTAERWGLGAERLRALNPALVYCSLPGFGSGASGGVGHDLNFTAASGLLALLGAQGVPRAQLADLGAGLLAGSAVLAALLRRARTGRGARVEQPVASGPLPFTTWSLADAGRGETGVQHSLLAGRTPSYRLYPCGDGRLLAVAAVEPKFWTAFLELVGLPELASAGADAGAAGERAAAAVARVLASEPRGHWLERAAERGLPVSAADDPETALAGEYYAGLLERTPLPDGGALEGAGPWLPSLGRTPGTPAPGLGEHTEALLREFAP